MAERDTVRLDLRIVLPVAALGVVVLAIIVVELCGREDIQPLAQGPATVENPSPLPVTPPTPGGEEPTPGPPTPTEEQEPAEGGDARDVTRQQDLDRVAQALEEYREENDSYPDSGGQVQSLCVFQADVGCELSEFLSPIPADPLGEPISENGYWFSSTGNTYSVYAQRESDQAPECPDHPGHLEGIDSLMCVQGP